MVAIGDERFDVVPFDVPGQCLFAAFSFGLIESFHLMQELREEAVQRVLHDWESHKGVLEDAEGCLYPDERAYSMFHLVIARSVGTTFLCELLSQCSSLDR